MATSTGNPPTRGKTVKAKANKRDVQLKRLEEFRKELLTMTEEERFYANAKRNLDTTKAILAQPQWCSTCWILKSYCVCGTTEKAHITLTHNVLFFMHAKEYGRLTNTAIAMLRGCPDSCMAFIDGVKADEDELNSIMTKNPYDVFVLTPSSTSVTYSEFLEMRKKKMQEDGVPKEKIEAKPHLNIIAVDSTWSQAKRMVKRIPSWVPHVRLADIHQTISPLRTQSSEGRVTTAEAVVILLREMGEDSSVTDAVFNLLKLRIDAVTGINAWKGTGKPRRDTGEKYPRASNVLESMDNQSNSDLKLDSNPEKASSNDDNKGE